MKTKQDKSQGQMKALLSQVQAIMGPTFGEGIETSVAISQYITDSLDITVMYMTENDALRADNERLRKLVESKTPRQYQQTIAQLREQVAGYEAAMQLEDWLN